ncbi:MAG: hypothetical protein IPG71_06545 [bacterium]|nr:hypothetical protein [bacterium]
MDDTNFGAADAWADTILSLHKDSVPGNALKARSSLALGDTASAKSAYEYAIESLTNGYDALMPDSTARPLTAAEKNYMDWIDVMLHYNYESLNK